MSLQYHFDDLQFSTLLPNFINVQTTPGSITVSGTLADGTTQNYSTTITLSGLTNFGDVYATRAGTKTALVSDSSVSGIFDFASSEFAQNSVDYSGGTVTVTITVNNDTGLSVTLHTQTFAIGVVEYMLPI